MAIYPTLFALYLGRLFPVLSGQGAGVYAGVVLIAVCAAWNLRGSRAVGSGSIALVLALAIPFGTMAAIAFFAPASEGGTIAAPAAALDPAAMTASMGGPEVRAVGGLTVAMWNYMGWDNAATIAGEVERPRRTYPLAMLFTVIAVAGSYLIAVAAAQRTALPASSWKTGSWVEAGEYLGGPWLARATAIGGMVSAAGMFTALTMSYSRVPMTLARDGFLPSTLARPSPRTGAPATAIIVCSVAYALCLGLGFERLVDLDVGIYGLSLILEFAALVALRIREPALARPFRIGGGWLGLGAVAVVPTAVLVWAAIDAAHETDQPIALALLTTGALLGGPVLYRYVRREGAAQSEPSITEIDRAE
jgi:amino acid transporter